MKYVIFFLFLSVLSIATYAKEGDFGVEVDVTTTGLFPPTLETVTVATVKAGSSAAQAGIKQGDKVVSIGGCAIPGCSAFKAKKIMKKKKGEKLQFEIVSDGGTAAKHELVAE